MIFELVDIRHNFHYHRGYLYLQAYSTDFNKQPPSMYLLFSAYKIKYLFKPISSTLILNAFLWTDRRNENQTTHAIILADSLIDCSCLVNHQDHIKQFIQK